jgi:hypothetical protein
MAKTLQRLIARLRNRAETSFKEITGQMDLARHLLTQLTDAT